MPPKVPSEPALTRGSRWRVVSEGGDGLFVSTGTFKGYVVFGHDSAVGIELDSSHGEDAGTVRIIPCSSVLSIDVLSLKHEEDEKTGDERGVYFG